MPQIIVDIAEAMGPSAQSPPRSEDPARRKLTETLLAACSAAAGNVTCVGGDAPEGPLPVALVRWRSNAWVHVEILPDGKAEGASARDVRFAPGSQQIERWRTVGYTVGTLASEALAAAAKSENGARSEESAASATTAADDAHEAPPAEDKTAPAAPNGQEASIGEKPPPTPAAENEAKATASEAPEDSSTSARFGAGKWWFAGGALLGPGLDGVRAGAFLRGSRSFGLPFATVAFAYSVDAADGRGLAAQRFSVSAGGGVELHLTRTTHLALRGELMAEHLTVDVEDSETHRTDEKSRWTPAFTAGAELAQSLTRTVALVGGAEAIVRAARTDIAVAHRPANSAPAIDAILLLGARIDLP